MVMGGRRQKELRDRLIQIGTTLECCLRGLSLLMGVLIVLPSFLAQLQKGLMVFESHLRRLRIYF